MEYTIMHGVDLLPKSWGLTEANAYELPRAAVGNCAAFYKRFPFPEDWKIVAESTSTLPGSVGFWVSHMADSYFLYKTANGYIFWLSCSERSPYYGIDSHSNHVCADWIFPLSQEEGAEFERLMNVIHAPGKLSYSLPHKEFYPYLKNFMFPYIASRNEKECEILKYLWRKKL